MFKFNSNQSLKDQTLHLIFFLNKLHLFVFCTTWCEKWTKKKKIIYLKETNRYKWEIHSKLWKHSVLLTLIKLSIFIYVIWKLHQFKWPIMVKKKERKEIKKIKQYSDLWKDKEGEKKHERCLYIYYKLDKLFFWWTCLPMMMIFGIIKRWMKTKQRGCHFFGLIYCKHFIYNSSLKLTVGKQFTSKV